MGFSRDWPLDDDRLLELGANIEERLEEAIREGKPNVIALLKRKQAEYLEEIERRS